MRTLRARRRVHRQTIEIGDARRPRRLDERHGFGKSPKLLEVPQLYGASGGCGYCSLPGVRYSAEASCSKDGLQPLPAVGQPQALSTHPA